MLVKYLEVEVYDISASQRSSQHLGPQLRQLAKTDSSLLSAHLQKKLKSIWRKCHNMHQGKLVRRKDWSVSTIGSFSDTNLGANIIHLFLSQYDRFCD